MSDVKYDGEYVLTADGSKDFGEISSEIAEVIKRQSGKIRLRIGVQNNNIGDNRLDKPKKIN